MPCPVLRIGMSGTGMRALVRAECRDTPAMRCLVLRYGMGRAGDQSAPIEMVGMLHAQYYRPTVCQEYHPTVCQYCCPTVVSTTALLCRHYRGV
eukprot:2975501-Rhodomonas_salina.4